MTPPLILALWTALSAALGLAGCTHAADPPGMQTVMIAERTFHLELALDDDRRFQGLSDRKEIVRDGGMLFVFPKVSDWPFVMRRCLVPIDLMFLDPSGFVITTHEMQVEPYERTDTQLKPYYSEWPYQFVVEMRGGTIRELGLKKAQKIELPTDDLKARAK
jgi:uncharacterized protein